MRPTWRFFRLCCVRFFFCVLLTSQTCCTWWMCVCKSSGITWAGSLAGVPHYMPVKCVKACRETTLFFFTCVAGNRPFVPRLNMRALPLLQASHTPSSRCHSFHFLQSKVGGSAALLWVRYGRRVCSYQQPLDVWSGLFYLACGFTRQSALFVGVVGLTLSCSHTVLCHTPSRRKHFIRVAHCQYYQSFYEEFSSSMHLTLCEHSHCFQPKLLQILVLWLLFKSLRCDED